MENYMTNPANSALDFADRMEQMYPDAYTRIYPHVHYLVSTVHDESLYGMTSEDIERITQEAMRRSNVVGDPPAGHNIHTLGDMTRAMVVRDFHDRHRNARFFPFFPPFFFFPFDDRFRDRDRDRDHDRDMDRRRNRY